jgi:accessory gene regulator B
MKVRLKDMDQEKCEVVNYGLYVMLSDIVKNLILLSVAYFLGILVYCITAMIAFAVLRTFFGGVHSKTFLGCLAVNSTLIISNVYLSLFLSGKINSLYMNSIIYILCFLIVIVYVPADHENKPVESKKQRRFLKVLSLVILIVHYLASVLFFKQPYSNILAISALISSVSTLPAVYKLTFNKHGDAYKNL